MNMFGCDLKFSINVSDRRRTKEFSFYFSDGIMIDLTKLTDTGNIFRFQSVYHAEKKTNKKIIFDSGASISISPDIEDFVEYSPTDGRV